MREWHQAGRRGGHRHFLLRPARALAARHQRKHQRAAAAVLPQGHRPRLPSPARPTGSPPSSTTGPANGSDSATRLPFRLKEHSAQPPAQGAGKRKTERPGNHIGGGRRQAAETLPRSGSYTRRSDTRRGVATTDRIRRPYVRLSGQSDGTWCVIATRSDPARGPRLAGRAPLGRPAAARPSATRLTPTRASRPRRAHRATPQSSGSAAPTRAGSGSGPPPAATMPAARSSDSRRSRERRD